MIWSCPCLLSVLWFLDWKKEDHEKVNVCVPLLPVCGQCVWWRLVPEACGGGGGFLRHHLRHARGDQRRPQQSTKARGPEENLQSCKHAAMAALITCLEYDGNHCQHQGQGFILLHLSLLLITAFHPSLPFSVTPSVSPWPCASSVSHYPPYRVHSLFQKLCHLLPHTHTHSLLSSSSFGLHSSFTVSSEKRKETAAFSSNSHPHTGLVSVSGHREQRQTHPGDEGLSLGVSVCNSIEKTPKT